MNSHQNSQQQNNKQIAVWLLVCCALIFSMVVLGGVTRLTHSGLSMVEWDPIMGAIPPLTQRQWEETFEKYQRFPEYQKINQGMSLEKFKSIFWFEYAHRILGRVIALVFLLPFLYFLVRKMIRRSFIPRLVTMFILGALQGLLGWYMVKSGLVDKPHVSQYRLTAHLAAAVIIYGYMFWVALDLLTPGREAAAMARKTHLPKCITKITALIVVMILTGGLVAGTRAGFAFNTFPLMNGEFFPPGLFALKPFYLNFFENIATVQFDHRLIAYALMLIIPWFWWRSGKTSLPRRTRAAIHLLLAMLIVQVTLGIATLLLVVPVSIAAAHQGGALLLFTIALFIVNELRAGTA